MAVLQSVNLVLELNGWCFRNLRKRKGDKYVLLGAAMAEEAVGVMAHQYGFTVPSGFRLFFGPTLLKLLLRIAPHVMPFDLQAYMKYHFFSKSVMAEQTVQVRKGDEWSHVW